jgi:hypothetical protein
MSSYASYCQDQGIDCARRASLARSLEVATYWRWLGGSLVQAWRAGTEDRWCPGPPSDELEASSFRFSDLDLDAK